MKIIDIRKFADSFKNRPKVSIKELPKGSVIYMMTENSTYTLEVIDPSECCVLANGGYFKKRYIEPATTYILGSTMGGSMIFKDQLIEGLFCEFYINSKRVLSSRIKKIFVNLIN
jgi:hypothetical protein